MTGDPLLDATLSGNGLFGQPSPEELDASSVQPNSGKGRGRGGG